MSNLLTNTTTKPIIQCSQVIVYNDSWTISSFEFIDTTTERIIYVSDKYKKNQTWQFDFLTADIQEGSEFYVKAIVEAGSDSTADVILQCYPNSNVTAYLKLTGTTFDTTLRYIGTQGTTTVDTKQNLLSDQLGDSLPVFQCSKIYAYNNSATVTKWALLTPDDTAMVYISGKYHVYEDWSLDLDNLERTTGTQFRLKAVVSAGADSLSNVLLEYIPDSNITAYFALKGNAFDSTLTFYGSSDPQLK